MDGRATMTHPPTAAPKIDSITALQEAIDGLSLAMFEALRGLRDAVAEHPTEDDNDATLVQRCVEGVMEKSRRIDQLLLLHNDDDDSSDTATTTEVLPGLPLRTRPQQMARIQALLEEQAAVEQDLRDVHAQAAQQRRACRRWIQRRTQDILQLDDAAVEER